MTLLLSTYSSVNKILVLAGIIVSQRNNNWRWAVRGFKLGEILSPINGRLGVFIICDAPWGTLSHLSRLTYQFELLLTSLVPVSSPVNKTYIPITGPPLVIWYGAVSRIIPWIYCCHAALKSVAFVRNRPATSVVTQCAMPPAVVSAFMYWQPS